MLTSYKNILAVSALALSSLSLSACGSSVSDALKEVADLDGGNTDNGNNGDGDNGNNGDGDNGNNGDGDNGNNGDGDNGNNGDGDNGNNGDGDNTGGGNDNAGVDPGSNVPADDEDASTNTAAVIVGALNKSGNASVFSSEVSHGGAVYIVPDLTHIGTTDVGDVIPRINSSTSGGPYYQSLELENGDVRDIKDSDQLNGGKSSPTPVAKVTSEGEGDEKVYTVEIPDESVAFVAGKASGAQYDDATGGYGDKFDLPSSYVLVYPKKLKLSEAAELEQFDSIAFFGQSVASFTDGQPDTDKYFPVIGTTGRAYTGVPTEGIERKDQATGAPTGEFRYKGVFGVLTSEEVANGSKYAGNPILEPFQLDANFSNSTFDFDTNFRTVGISSSNTYSDYQLSGNGKIDTENGTLASSEMNFVRRVYLKNGEVLDDDEILPSDDATLTTRTARLDGRFYSSNRFTGDDNKATSVGGTFYTDLDGDSEQIEFAGAFLGHRPTN